MCFFAEVVVELEDHGTATLQILRLANVNMGFVGPSYLEVKHEKLLTR